MTQSTQQQPRFHPSNVVAVDGQTQGAKNQYFSEIHARATITTAGGYH